VAHNHIARKAAGLRFAQPVCALGILCLRLNFGFAQQRAHQRRAQARLRLIAPIIHQAEEMNAGVVFARQDPQDIGKRRLVNILGGQQHQQPFDGCSFLMVVDLPLGFYPAWGVALLCVHIQSSNTDDCFSLCQWNKLAGGIFSAKHKEKIKT
jgi:hypothetical protein